MSDTKKNRDNEIERDIRNSQKFSFKNALARSGGGMLDGASPTPQLAQAKALLSSYIEKEVADGTGALIRTLIEWVNGDLAVVRNSSEPLVGLKEIVSGILSDDSRLHEFVRQVDVTYGKLMHERPHFQQPGEPPHADDVYTHESVRLSLQKFFDEKLS